MDEIARELQGDAERVDLMNMVNDRREVDHAQVVEEINSFVRNYPDIDKLATEQSRQHGIGLYRPITCWMTSYLIFYHCLYRQLTQPQLWLTNFTMLCTSDANFLVEKAQFLPRDALYCKARYCDRMSSVCPSVRPSVRL